MKISFPSSEFDDAVAAVCHGTSSEEQCAALREVLLADAHARDEYLRRVSLHAFLASESGLFSEAIAEAREASGKRSGDPASFRTQAGGSGPFALPSSPWWSRLALAAGIAVLLAAAWSLWFRGGKRPGETSRAVAMLNRVVNVRWSGPESSPRLGAPLEPGLLSLESGLAQIVLYNGARIIIEGPTEIRLVSSSEVSVSRGILTAEVPPPARGFRVETPLLDIVDLGTAFGLKVSGEQAELHVFEGRVQCQIGNRPSPRDLSMGEGAVVSSTQGVQRIDANRELFPGHFDLHALSVAAESQRYDHWRETIRELQRDSSLWVHLDFEDGGGRSWRLRNSGSRRNAIPDATIVGCEWVEGRWATKPALEFRGLSDRVRLDVPGGLQSLTLAAWVRVHGLDREINSLFMSDGFMPGTLHWLIRNDGVLGLTVIGENGDHQIFASPPMLTFDQFGIWTHLAIVLDGPARQVVHYFNGRPASRHVLRVPPPFHFGAAELGNWNPLGFPGNSPFLIRNFSGAMDEFCLFNRALSPNEIRSLFAAGRPQPDHDFVSNPDSINPIPHP